MVIAHHDRSSQISGDIAERLSRFMPGAERCETQRYDHFLALATSREAPKCPPHQSQRDNMKRKHCVIAKGQCEIDSRWIVVSQSAGIKATGSKP
jgi:hypothetical protein